MDTISQRRTFHIRIANVNFRINGYYALISFGKIAKGYSKKKKHFQGPYVTKIL